MLETYPDTLQLEDVCEILHISPNTTYNLLRSHQLSGFKCGKSWLIPKDSVIQFIQQNLNF